MSTDYEIAIDVDINGGEDEYMETASDLDDSDLNAGTYGFEGEKASFYITRTANSLDDAFIDVASMLTDADCAGNILGFRDMRTIEHCLGTVEAGYLPEGYTHVSSDNPYLTGHYWCLCKVGFDTPKMEFRKVYFKREHNSRWYEEKEMKVLAWTK